MRPILDAEVPTAVEVTAQLPFAHGAPVMVGNPGELGITDLGRPDWGDVVLPEPGETPVFWACGVTPQAAIQVTRPPYAVTHAPGHMFVTDLVAA